MPTTTTRIARIDIPQDTHTDPKRTWLTEDRIIMLICLVFLGIALFLVGISLGI